MIPPALQAKHCVGRADGKPIRLQLSPRDDEQVSGLYGDGLLS
jgi:hypothetical protein